MNIHRALMRHRVPRIDKIDNNSVKEGKKISFDSREHKL